MKKSVTITLLPYWEWNLRITYAMEDSIWSGVSPYKNNRYPDYKDYAVFDLNIKTNSSGVVATVSNIKNYEPTCTPSIYVTNEVIWQFTQDPYGQIDIDSVFTLNNDGLSPDSIIEFSVYHGHATYPGFKSTTIISGEVYNPAPVPFGYPYGVPDIIDIDLKRSMPYIDPYGGIWKSQYLFVVPIQ